jgi:ketosteroid isomerase-like protein
MQHDNAARLLEAAQAFAEKDDELAARYLAPDFVLHVPGTNQISGRYLGPDGFREYAARLQTLTAHTFTLTPVDTLGSDDHAAGVYATSARRNGRHFDGRIVNLYRMVDGTIIEGWLHPTDFLSWNQFWS